MLSLFDDTVRRATKLEALKKATFGERVAEEEAQDLERYFVQTPQWEKLCSGEIDIVYGLKGSGKSALYSLLSKQAKKLKQQGIVFVSGENPQGQTAFRNIALDPPTSQNEFRVMWKMFILALVSDVLVEEQVSAPAAETVIGAIQELGLRQPRSNLTLLVRTVRTLAARWLRPSAAETGIRLDDFGRLSGFTLKIMPGTDPSLSSNGVTLDDLLGLCDTALRSVGLDVWIALDRLDVAFEDSSALEANALRALFRVYLDLKSYASVKLKIFLRTDIWERITDEGFPEASHITKSVYINWDRSSLLNLLARRAVQNEAIRSYYGVDPEEVLASQETQQLFFYRLFPDQVEPGDNKPKSFDWMLGRTRDGSQKNAPRELIHLANAAVEKEAQRIQIGGESSQDGTLISRFALKDGLPDVSRVRLESVLYSEYPELKSALQSLRRQKTFQNTKTLAEIWKLPNKDATQLAERLVKVGFFEQRGTRERPEYWVPFLYRPALELVQGKAFAEPTSSVGEDGDDD